MFDQQTGGEEIHFDPSDIIVSKTDLTGRIVYANDIFCDVAEAHLSDVLGQPHSCIRHPDMPRAVFHLLWGEIKQGREIFAYVKNRSMKGRFYWVLAHVTPSFTATGEVVGYHSNRRVPNRNALKTIIPLYEELRALEMGTGNKKDQMEASVAYLSKILADRGQTYGEFVWDLETGHV